MSDTFMLVTPSIQYLPEYLFALKRGWSGNNLRVAETALEEISEIQNNPENFIARKSDDRDAKGGHIILPDGSVVQRLPGFSRWLWDGEFCGNISFRWQLGTSDLPEHVLGHIGYSVVPWKQRRGYATKALGFFLQEVAAEGLSYIEIITDPDNIPSQKVALANNAVLIERFHKPAQYDYKEGLRYRIELL